MPPPPAKTFLNILRKQNIKLSPIDYTNNVMTQVKSRRLDSRPQLLDLFFFFYYKTQGTVWGEKGMSGGKGRKPHAYKIVKWKNKNKKKDIK